jgi:hypothetical protein
MADVLVRLWSYYGKTGAMNVQKKKKTGAMPYTLKKCLGETGLPGEQL